MFARGKKNKSGIISVQIIDKSSGKYKMIETVGSSGDPETIDRLFSKARKRITVITGQDKLPFDKLSEADWIDTFVHGIERVELVGPEMLLGKFYNEIGFNKIQDELLRHLVIARLAYPASKLKTSDYLLQYKGVEIDVNKIYRYLDKLHKEQIQQAQAISYAHTLKILNNQISIVFYDVTTLYFEAEDEDDLRKTGFSKDGKHQQPQIVLGLLVSSGGYPLAYEIFEGNTFEGHTMIPVIEAFKVKYQLQQLAIVADAGLMSEKNINSLSAQGFKYIIGGRIKNETDVVKKQILKMHFKDGQSQVLVKSSEQRLVISYSGQRAKKDEYNRQRGIAKLEKAIVNGKLTKKQLHNRGYNKYLKMDGEVTIAIDYSKLGEDKRWDGLKGYITNTDLSKEEIIASYKQLWMVEKAFRISKTDLRIRPIYHYVKRRIEAHVCIAFIACKIYKELERQLKDKKSDLSPEKVIGILRTINAITFTTPYSKNTHTRLIIQTEAQKNLIELFALTWVSQ